MHSSTVHCSGRPWGGGRCLPGGGVSALWGGVCPGECLPAIIPPVDRMTDTCKTLPCRNYVADDKKHIFNGKMTIMLEKQESFPVGSIPPACADCNSFKSHQMSTPVGEGSSIEQF